MKSAQYGLVGRVPHTEGLSHSLVSWKINKTCQTHQEDSGELANNTLPLPILKHLHLLTDERGQLDNNPLLQSLDKQNNFTPTKNKSHSIWTSTKSYLNYSWSSIRGGYLHMYMCECAIGCSAVCCLSHKAGSEVWSSYYSYLPTS